MRPEGVSGPTAIVSAQRTQPWSVRGTSIAVPAVALSVGALASVIDARFGLFASALVLGWTQLVGL